MRLILLLFLAAGLAFPQVNALTPKEAADGWLLLFDGESLHGWTAEGGSKWRVSEGAISPDVSATGWLRSNAAFGDFVLKAEFRAPKGSNSGIFVRSGREGAPHVTGYEIQIWDDHKDFKTGSLVHHVKAKKAALKADTWHNYEVQATGDRFVIKLDGRTVLDARDAKSKYGHFGLQVNKDSAIEFRNVKVKPLGLKPVFNGKDLSGWQRVDRENVKEPPVWSVKDGMLNVVKGAGQLETEATYKNFILQLDVRTNSSAKTAHPNSGIFFRGVPKAFWTGYEAQIRNEYKAGDRTQAVDYGTGGIYNYQPARKVVSNDDEFFRMTVLAHGRYIATWVNGYPVGNWEDPHPEGEDVRKKQAVLKAGPISLQAHDPTTNLNFKNIQIVNLPD